MNITHAEPYEDFVARYREATAPLRPILDAFPPDRLRQWIHELGVETFIGTSGRVFPKEMKAAPLLRAWLHRLRQQGVKFHQRHRWVGLEHDSAGLAWHIDQGGTTKAHRFTAVILALGGASWPKLGSDGQWTRLLEDAGVNINPLQASNCGFELPWSTYLQERFAGTPLKNVRVTLTGLDGVNESKTGEMIISNYGIEGSLIYAHSSRLRELLLHTPDKARVVLDWLPHNSVEQIAHKLSQAKKESSLSKLLRQKLNLPPVALALLKECCSEVDTRDPAALACALKAMPLPTVTATRPISEAISCAGGVPFAELDGGLMLNALPGVFVAGEMIDWEAPTGGYLLTACFATGRWSGAAAVKWLQTHKPIG